MAEKKEDVHIWLNFDFGIRGDFEGLYTLLDKYKADDCGSDFAYFKTNYNKEIVKTLREEIAQNVNLKKTDRIYIIVHYKNKVLKGFLFGGKRRAVWEGYAMEKPADFYDIL